ncbi:uncharacterized protein LOC107274484 isoform X2 [Cephus cinctus]|uniref:Uncharacterized protein LOC107274484 isoform X2 n=1 Tax=Cephus cinctus TaxID=211228 RepID=A0AAJ7RVJ6_CEPCN|nr:uncharacterized protein LOC107274484 isoform X2 [Cephus cinctus]
MGSTRILYFLSIVFFQVSGFPCKRKENIFKNYNIYHTNDLLHRPDLSMQQPGQLLSRLLHQPGFYRTNHILNSYDGSNQIYQNSVNRINDFDRTIIATASGIGNGDSWNLLNKKTFLLGMNDRFHNLLHKSTFPVDHYHPFGWHSRYHGIPYDTRNEDHIVVKKPAVFSQVIPTVLKKEDSKVSDVVEVGSKYDGVTEKIDKTTTDAKFQLLNMSLEPATNIPITEDIPETSNANESITEEPQTYSTNDTMTSLNPAVTNLPDTDVSEFSDTTFNILSTEMITTTEDLVTENVNSCLSKIICTLRTLFDENFEATKPTVIMDSHPEISTQRITTDCTTATSMIDSSDNISIQGEFEKSETTHFAPDDFVADESSGLVMLLTTAQYIPEATTTTAPTAVHVAEVIDSLSTLSGTLSVVDTHSESTPHVSTINIEEVATEMSSIIDLNIATEVSNTETTMGILIATDLISDVIKGLKNDFISANDKKTLSKLYRKLWPYLIEESKRKDDEPMNELLASFLQSAGLVGQEENKNWRVKRENSLNFFQDTKSSDHTKIANNPIVLEDVSKSIENYGSIELPNVEDFFDDNSHYFQFDDDHEDEDIQKDDKDNDHRYYDLFNDHDVFIEKPYLSIFKDDDGIDLLESL